jgi:hypothetical protein
MSGVMRDLSFTRSCEPKGFTAIKQAINESAPNENKPGFPKKREDRPDEPAAAPADLTGINAC